MRGMHRVHVTSLICSLVIMGAAMAQPGAARHIAGGQLMLDDSIIESMNELRRELHEPVRREVALIFDAPWEGPQMGYPTVLRDPSGEYRLYYRGGGDVTTREVTCLARSDDGIHWERPAVGLIEFEGSTENNIIWTGDTPSYSTSHNFSPFLDTNPAASPEARYKAVALLIGEDDAGDRHRMLGVAGSPDGIHWRMLSDGPVIRQGGFDSLNVAFWDPGAERYVCYSRVGRNGLRSIQRSTSDDFLHWSAPEPLEFDPPQTEQFYTNAVTICPGSPHLYLGFPMRFNPERRTVGLPPRETDGLSDGVLIWSRDGVQWRQSRTAFLRPGRNPNNWGNAHGNSTMATGILALEPDKFSVYWIENCEEMPWLRRGTLRRDGFASLRGDAEAGGATTRPFTFEGSQLTLNVSTSAVGGARVEIQDVEGNPIDGFGMDDCDWIWGDEIARPVVWNGEDDLSALAGGPIRLRFTLRDADLYSFAFR